MSIKKYVLVLLIIALAVQVKSFAQSIDREVIASVGGKAKVGKFQLTWTAGELATESFTLTHQLDQGFQQTFDIAQEPSNFSSVSQRKSLKQNIQVKAYPNPCMDYLMLNALDMGETVRLDIVNAQGQLIWNGTVSAKQRINTTEWLPGAYFLRMTNSNNDSNTISIYKIQ